MTMMILPFHIWDHLITTYFNNQVVAQMSFDPSNFVKLVVPCFKEVGIGSIVKVHPFA